jgi:hypothetical protein
MQLSVNSLVVNQVTQADFDLSIPGGAIVMRPDGTSERLPGNRELMLEDLAEVSRGYVRWNSGRAVFWIVNGIVVVAIVAFAVYRWRRNRGRDVQA